jgi:hypothetical protein
MLLRRCWLDQMHGVRGVTVCRFGIMFRPQRVWHAACNSALPINQKVNLMNVKWVDLVCGVDNAPVDVTSDIDRNHRVVCRGVLLGVDVEAVLVLSKPHDELGRSCLYMAANARGQWPIHGVVAARFRQRIEARFLCLARIQIRQQEALPLHPRHCHPSSEENVDPHDAPVLVSGMQVQGLSAREREMSRSDSGSRTQLAG